MQEGRNSSELASFMHQPIKIKYSENAINVTYL